MARVRIQPGGVVLLAVVVLGALLFLFFELKPSAPRKPVTESTPPRSVSAPESAQISQPKEEKKQVPAAATEKESVQVPQQYAMKPTSVDMPIRIYFGFNRAGINKNVYCIFDRIEELAHQNGAKRLRIVVEGNADSIGPSWYNVELSRRRAARVADSLSRRLGIPLKNFTLVANGSTKPISSNSTRDGRANNRRTDVIIYR